MSNVGYNQEKGQYFATFQFEDKYYMITWRPKTKDDGVEFDVGILPVKEESDEPSKRVNGKKSKDETSIRKHEKSRS